MRKIIKNNYKFILGLIIGFILSVGGVYAASAIIESKEVAYDNANSHGTYNNVQDTIDELYERSGLKKTKWVDPVLNGADPVLGNGLIPVTIDGDGNVYYANEYTEWYNYKEKRWANAVILTDEAKEYQDDKEYKVGMQIKEADIESYFVWIPRYQYKIWDLGNYNSAYTPSNLANSQDGENVFWKVTGNNNRIIDIQFGTVEKYPKMAEPTSVGVYYTHPAFTLGSKNLNGIWVGKFETGGSTDSLVVKPNVSSLTNNAVKIFFDAAKEYEEGLDSHMMKNTEWGAVVYLSHSEYGIGNKVNINNASDLKTGYSAAANTNQTKYAGDSAASSNKTKTQSYDTAIGHLASITGNISGIYDMSGGSWEYVAAYVKGYPSLSGFNTDQLNNYVSLGYIDEYPANSTSTSFNNRILGDATGELGPFYNYVDGNGSSFIHSSWYSDFANEFPYTGKSWFVRGGDMGSGVLSGQFAFTGVGGESMFARGFRLVLSPIN